MKRFPAYLFFVVAFAACSASSRPVPGPDKQFAGEMQGMITGAGAGAATGFQVTAGTGPGALVGAGFGALAGGIHGALEDAHEETMLQLEAETLAQRRRADAQAVIENYYQKRLALHPTRDIFPADLFFSADNAKLSPRGQMIVSELARLNKNRLPWSRLVIATYIKSADEHSDFANYLAKKRAIELGDAFIKNGIEARRIETRPIVTNTTVLIDPEDKPLRYAQAVELIPVDR